MAFNYTPDQQKAIKDRPEGNILVSASAGSGKTRVLVDRIIDMVKNQHVDIDQLLVVTFTNAAAKEMRQRLQIALREEFSNAPENEKSRLLTQIQKVAVADITTMDAYCQKLVDRYYYLLGIDPNFRILADDTEKALLKDQVWDAVREDLYGNDDDGSFAASSQLNDIPMIQLNSGKNFIHFRRNVGLVKVTFIQTFAIEIVKVGHIVQPSLRIVGNVGELIKPINQVGQAVITAVIGKVFSQAGK